MPRKSADIHMGVTRIDFSSISTIFLKEFGTDLTSGFLLFFTFGRWAVMYMYAKGIDFACFYNFSIRFWNTSDNVVCVVLISTTYIHVAEDVFCFHLWDSDCCLTPLEHLISYIFIRYAHSQLIGKPNYIDYWVDDTQKEGGELLMHQQRCT